MDAEDSRLAHHQFAGRQVDGIPGPLGLRLAGLKLFQQLLAGVLDAGSAHRLEQVAGRGLIAAGTRSSLPAVSGRT